MSTTSDHNKIIKKAFTQQADAYASNPTIIDPDWALRLVNAAQPTADDRVLEVATGPGYVALAFAKIVDSVIGIDITDAPLAIAEKNKAAQGLNNVRFEPGDAYKLAFADAAFDKTVCRLAIHHFAEPETVLQEMARVCRPGGKVIIEDLIASENPSRAAYYNHWERLRDPSHTTALSLSKLIGLYAANGLEVIHIQMEDRTQVVEQWMENSQTPPERAEEIRQLLADDQEQTLSGIHIFRDQDNQLCFYHRMATIVGHKI